MGYFPLEHIVFSEVLAWERFLPRLGRKEGLKSRKIKKFALCVPTHRHADCPTRVRAHGRTHWASTRPPPTIASCRILRRLARTA